MAAKVCIKQIKVGTMYAEVDNEIMCTVYSTVIQPVNVKIGCDF